MKKYKIIINADDLGLSNEVNVAIEKAISGECISSSTIMANAPAFDDAIRIAKLYPHISFGVHLNIDEFYPLTEPSVFVKYGMIAENGAFKKEYLQNTNISFCNELLEAIYNEWKAQIEKMRDAGINPSHFDSHEHTHGIFGLQPVLVRLIKEYGVIKVRRRPFSSIFDMVVIKLMHLNQHATTEKNMHSYATSVENHRSFLYRRLHQLVDAYQHRLWIRDIRKEDIAVTDYFDGYQKFCNCYPKLFKYRNMETIELMVHPGHNGYFAETEMLMQKKLQSVCQYELVNYNQL